MRDAMSPVGPTIIEDTPLSEALTNTEKAIIEAALEGCRGRVSGPSGAAVKLGIPRSTLESRIRNLEIDKHSFRTERRASLTGKSVIFFRKPPAALDNEKRDNRCATRVPSGRF